GSPLVKNHVAEPENVGQAAMTLNDGGVGLLREKLRPLCNPELKRRQITITLDEKREQLLAKLAPFYRSDDHAELRKRQEQLSRTLVALLARLAEKQLFGEFLAALQVHDFDLHEICSRMGQENTDTAGAPATAPVVGTRVSASDILDDIYGDSTPAPQPETTEAQSSEARDSAAIFAGRALEHWVGRLRDLAGNAEARNRYNFPARELDQFCHELITASARYGLRQKLEDELRRNAAYSNMTRERLVWKQVSLAADAINAFVNWLGFDPRFKHGAERTILFGGKNVCLFEPPAPFSGEPRIGEEEAPYDRLWYTDWLRALAWSVIANADFDDGQHIDHEQNNRLHHILQAFGG
ncbi:MAG: virulence factor SrfC family protein, partial [Desulfovibrionaceae bacterium]|nr:virulence factor SrfC family protein [Desulfovibrionaceae bacterium]